MAFNSAIIAIETDYEFVKNKIEHNTARFLLDFNNVQGPLRNQLTALAIFMESTAKKFAAAQTEKHTGNLIAGIHAEVNNNVIELKSSAYKMPMKGNKALGGKDLARKRTYWRHTRRAERDEDGNYVRDKNGNIQYKNIEYQYRTPKVIQYRHVTSDDIHEKIKEAASKNFWFGRIVPQHIPSAADTGYRGATGLGALGSHHIARYNVTRNIQYYGAHIEFGHRALDGSFVEARPHLRPALRVASAASIGQFQSVLKSMVSGIGSSFDGYKTPSLTFGLNNVLGVSGVSQMARDFAQTNANTNYSIRHGGGMWNNVLKNDMGWGHIRRPVDYYKYGYQRNIPAKFLQSQPNKMGRVFSVTEDEAVRGVRSRPWGTGKHSAPKGQAYYLNRKSNGQYKWELGKDNTQVTRGVHWNRLGPFTTQQYQYNRHIRMKSPTYRKLRQERMKKTSKARQISQIRTNKTTRRIRKQTSKRTSQQKSERKSKPKRQRKQKRKSPKSVDFSKMTPEQEQEYYQSQLGYSGMNILKQMRRDD